MELNTNVWGNGVSLSNGGGIGITINDVYCANGNVNGSIAQNFEQLINTGKVAVNVPYDDSLSWGIKFNSLLSDNIAVQYFPGGEKKSVATNTNLLPFLAVTNGSSSIGNQTNTYWRRLAYGVTEATPKTNWIYPVTKIPLNRLCIMVYVATLETNEYSVQLNYIPYNDFMAKSADEKSKYSIVGIECEPFYGTKTNRTYDGYNNRIIIAWRTENQMSGYDNQLYSFNAFTGLRGYGSFALGGVSTVIYSESDPRPAIFCGYSPDLFDVSHFETRYEHYVICHLKDWKYLTTLFNALADLGLYYTGNLNSAQNSELGENCTDPNIICGDIDDEGKMTGIPHSGEDIKKHNKFTPFVNTANDYTNNNFNGENKTDPNNYTDKIDLNKPTLTPVDVFNRSYAINATTVRNFADFLWNADETKFNEIIKGLGLMGENPINGIIDLRLYPFNVATKNGVTTAEEIAIGRIATGITGIKLTNSVNSMIDLGKCSFFTKFENFLDYEPYTTAQLYIPYIGVVPVSTAEFMGHNISVKMIVDYVTGACCAIVFKDDIPFIYRNGVIGVDIPITGTNSAQFANSVIGNVITGAESALGAVTSGNITGMVTGGISALENIYSAFTTPTMYQTAGASSPAVANWQPQNCYFIIDLPEPNIPNSYGHNVGYACEYTDTLGNCSGFTVCGNPTINFKCTSEEQKMLSELLKSGVYI